jgi:YjbE family integral membrane protein
MNFDYSTIFNVTWNLSFLLAILNIIFINIVLSGDNAVVIALAVRNLPKQYQTKAIALGAGLAVVLRVILTFFVVLLMEISFLKLVGGLLIFWIAVQLLIEDDGEEKVQASSSLWKAVQIILIADLTMSLDNVLGVAGAANGSLLLLIFGLGLSIPIIVVGSKILSNLMQRFPIIVVLGAAVLGRVAGELIITDPAVERWIHPTNVLNYFVQGLCIVGVVVGGKYLNYRKQKAAEGINAIPVPETVRADDKE